jgi:hypothetical protein
LDSGRQEGDARPVHPFGREGHRHAGAFECGGRSQGWASHSGNQIGQPFEGIRQLT